MRNKNPQKCYCCLNWYRKLFAGRLDALTCFYCTVSFMSKLNGWMDGWIRSRRRKQSVHLFLFLRTRSVEFRWLCIRSRSRRRRCQPSGASVRGPRHRVPADTVTPLAHSASVGTWPDQRALHTSSSALPLSVTSQRRRRQIPLFSFPLPPTTLRNEKQTERIIHLLTCSYRNECVYTVSPKKWAP